jgi:hypothetical protein
MKELSNIDELLTARVASELIGVSKYLEQVQTYLEDAGCCADYELIPFEIAEAKLKRLIRNLQEGTI